MPTNWSDYLKSGDPNDIPHLDAFGNPKPEKWYNVRKWNVNDWASFASIFGTSIFWAIERKSRNKPKLPPDIA